MRNLLSTRGTTTWLIAIFAVLWVAGTGTAKGNLGIGIILGEPTGLSVNMRLGAGVSAAGAAAWSFRDEGAIHLHGDYLRHRTLDSPPTDSVAGDRINTTLHYGLGGRIKAESDARLSLRFPVGVTGHLRNEPVDLFIEVVPLLDVAPATAFNLNAALGARYYF